MTAACEIDTVFPCCLLGCKRRCKRALAVFFCFVFALNVVLFVFFEKGFVVVFVGRSRVKQKEQMKKNV